ncbi:tetratricopeptide repeat protein, partial [Streptomyces sp. BE20]|nr:tetratricopeptide repeat protein [Streptomyces sp. BE20]
LPGLARSLNNLANHQSDVGDRAAALTSATEAVAHYLKLADTGPTPDGRRLERALALGPLNPPQAVDRDPSPAHATATDAVTHYRTLADTDPRAHLPGLAGSLNNLANRQSEVGDRAAALTSATEAVGHYIELADSGPSPDAFLIKLADALCTLSAQQADNG